MLIDLASFLSIWRVHLIPCPAELSAKCLRGLSLHTPTQLPKAIIKHFDMKELTLSADSNEFEK